MGARGLATRVVVPDAWGTPIGSPLFHAGRGLARLLAATCLRLRVNGIEHVPLDGGILVVSNHLSIADPPLVAAIMPRPVAFMGKAELFRNPFLGFLFRQWGVFPVRRGEVDVGAVRTALALLKDGAAVVVFPEGTRRPDRLSEALPGIGYFAARSECLVVPVGVTGTEVIRSPLSLRLRPQVNVNVGPAFIVPKGSSDEGATIIMQNIAALLPKERRGHYDASDPAAGPAEPASGRS